MNVTNEMTLSFSARSENEAFARVAVAAFVSQLDPTMEELNDLKTVISEAVTNAIIHGYDSDPSGKVIIIPRGAFHPGGQDVRAAVHRGGIGPLLQQGPVQEGRDQEPADHHSRDPGRRQEDPRAGQGHLRVRVRRRLRRLQHLRVHAAHLGERRRRALLRRQEGHAGHAAGHPRAAVLP